MLVTGFGLFRKYKKNPSSECVHLFKNTVSDRILSVCDFIFLPEINVQYQSVDDLNYRKICGRIPDIIINCGVSHEVKDKIKLETVAHRTGYLKVDITNCIPREGECQVTNYNPKALNKENPCDMMLTRINVTKLCSKNNNRLMTSTDAGRYLCEYIFYKSLTYCTNSIFVHVGEDKYFSTKENCDQLKKVVEFCIDEYWNKEKNDMLYRQNLPQIYDNNVNYTEKDEVNLEYVNNHIKKIRDEKKLHNTNKNKPKNASNKVQQNIKR